MNARNLGFMSSWRMLTRDKGWLKPVLILTLISWIPVLGQIIVLGYALEWARLTAWGVDAAPKQHGVDYGKVLSTGGRAFLVTISLGFVMALALQILFPGSLAWIMSSAFGAGATGVTSALALVSGTTLSLVAIVMAAFVGLFLQAASLRATLYDSFSAGWRLDRLGQMVVRDFGGFCKTWLVNLIGGVIQGAYTFVVALIGVVVLMGGVVGAIATAGMSGGYMTGQHFVLDQLLRMGAGPLLLFVLLVIALSFVGSAITTAMTLVAINAMGQWFCRFDVDRWGVSSDPLPEGAPHRGDDWGAAEQAPPAPPVPPVPPASAEGQGCDGEPEANGGAVTSDAASPRPGRCEAEAVAPEQVRPLDAEPEGDDPAAAGIEPSEAPVAVAEPVEPLDATRVAAGPRDEGHVEDVVPLDGPCAGDVPAKRPIPLGPITEDGAEPCAPGDDEGPIRA